MSRQVIELKRSVDKFRLCVTLLTAIYLAFATQSALSFLVTHDGQRGDVTFEILPGDGINLVNPNGRLLVMALLGDGAAVRLSSATNKSGWSAVPEEAPRFLYAGSKGASVSFPARRAVVILNNEGWSGQVRLRRGTQVLQNMELRSAEGGQITLQTPAPAPSPALLIIAMLAFAGLASWMGPITVERPTLPWLLFFLSAIHLLYWATEPIGTNNDLRGYLEAPHLVWSGTTPDNPPGYGALLWVLSSLSGAHSGTLTTLVQHGLVIVGSLCIHRCLRKIVSEGAALLGSVLAGALPASLIAAQAIIPESVTGFAMVGAFLFSVRSMERDDLRSALAAGALIGWAGLLKVVPLAGLSVAVLILSITFQANKRVRQLWTIGLTAAAVFVAPILWTGFSSGHFALTNSTGGHLYNRFIADQKLLDENGPATKRLMGYLGGKNPTEFRHWELDDFIHEDKDSLLKSVSTEAIRNYPVRAVMYTFPLAWREFIAPTDWISTWAEAVLASPEFENDSPLPVSVASLEQRSRLDAINVFVWPALCAMAILGVVLGLMGSHRGLVGAQIVIPLAFMLGTACADIFCPRYNAAVVPFVAAFAVLPIESLRRMIAKTPGIRRSSAPVASREPEVRAAAT